MPGHSARNNILMASSTKFLGQFGRLSTPPGSHFHIRIHLLDRPGAEYSLVIQGILKFIKVSFMFHWVLVYFVDLKSVIDNA